MIKTITMRGLGPHVDTTLAIPAPMGWTVFSGPSRDGKTHLIEAVTGCLWGVDGRGAALPVEAIRDGEDALEVEVSLANRYLLARRMNRKRAVRRIVERPGREADRHTTEDAWRAAIGPLGVTPDLLRLVVSPMAWAPLADGERGGAPLRDALARMLPDAELPPVVARLMQEKGHEPSADDPTTAAGAEEYRRDCRRDVHRLEGAVEERERIVAEAEDRDQRGDAPPPEEVDAAEATLVVARKWEQHRAALARAEAAEGARKDAAARHVEWVRRHSALGDRPDEPAARIGAAREKLRAAEQARKDAETEFRAMERRAAEMESSIAVMAAGEALIAAQAAYRDADRALASARRALDELPADDTCPTCGKRWAEARKRREEREAAVADAETATETAKAALAKAEVEEEARLHAAQEFRDAATEEARSRVSEAGRRVVGAEGTERAAREALDALLSLGSDAAAWDTASRALGPAPTIPAEVTMPEPPATREPTALEVAGAREVITQADQCRGAAGQRAVDLTGARTALADAREALDARRGELLRRDALVACWREAPSEAIRHQVEALDCGPVTLRLVGQGVDVRVDGRDWHRASDGELARADLYLRAALRRLLAEQSKAPRTIAALPIIVDRAQDLAEADLPPLDAWLRVAEDISGPVWLLLTSPGTLRARALETT